jgi:hypothetical protein
MGGKRHHDTHSRTFESLIALRTSSYLSAISVYPAVKIEEVRRETYRDTRKLLLFHWPLTMCSRALEKNVDPILEGSFVHVDDVDNDNVRADRPALEIAGHAIKLAG